MGKMSGLGSGIVVLWAYNQIAAIYGLQPMPAEVAAAIAAVLIECGEALLRFVMPEPSVDQPTPPSGG